MKQYMPMKPVKRGFKVWVRADSVTGYFCDFDVYVGKPSDRTTTEVGLGERVVLQLSASLRGGNYQLFFDNFFTSCHLLDTLLSQQLYCCGTIRTHRRGFPETLKGVTLERGSHLFCQRGNLVASVWMDKNSVNMLSTLSQADATHTAQRKQQDGTRVSVQCTDAVVLYNRYMGGVDKRDQLRQYYRVRTRCRKYYKYIFWFLFDVAITNSYILSLFTPTTIPRTHQRLKAFRLRLLTSWLAVTTVANSWAVLVPCYHIILLFNQPHHNLALPHHSPAALHSIYHHTWRKRDGADTACTTGSHNKGMMFCGIARIALVSHHCV